MGNIRFQPKNQEESARTHTHTHTLSPLVKQFYGNETCRNCRLTRKIEVAILHRRFGYNSFQLVDEGTGGCYSSQLRLPTHRGARNTSRIGRILVRLLPPRIVAFIGRGTSTSSVYLISARAVCFQIFKRSPRFLRKSREKMETCERFRIEMKLIESRNSR